MFQSLNHVDVNLKPRLIKSSGYYIVPSPSTALQHKQESQRCMEVVKYSDQGFLEALPNVSKADCHMVTVAPLILDTRG